MAGCTGGAGGESEPTSGSGTAPPVDATVTVGPDGSLVFDPERVAVDPGATVAWVWESSNHSVTPERQPSDADWRGTAQETRPDGERHEHTFEIEGTYEYYCVPHRGAGMVGTLVVGDGENAKP